MHSSKSGLIAVAVLFLGGCTAHKVQQDVPVPEQTPETFSQTGGSTTLTTDAAGWWTAFADPALDAATEGVLTGNLDLQGAWARLEQFDAVARQAGAPLLPAVDANFSPSRSKFLGFGQTNTFTVYDLGIDVTYEVDIWKRLASGQKAARLDAVAGRQDVEALALTLTASAGRTWYNLVAARQRLAVLERQVATSAKQLETIETRFANGAVGAVDVYQQRENLASIKSQIPVVLENIDLLEHGLAVLQGKAPKTAAPEGAELTLPDALPALGVPLDLLQNRPDIQAAQMRLAAADYRIAVAVADRWPALRLTASTGWQADDISDLFSNWVWTLAGNIVGPIFDNGRRAAEVDRTRAVLRERIAAFEGNVLNAVREVEDALAMEQRQRERLARLQEQYDLAQKALDAAETRYLRGVGSFLSVLTSTQALQRVELDLVTAQSGVVSGRIDLYLALGGHWTNKLEDAQRISATQGDN